MTPDAEWATVGLQAGLLLFAIVAAVYTHQQWRKAQRDARVRDEDARLRDVRIVMEISKDFDAHWSKWEKRIPEIRDRQRAEATDSPDRSLRRRDEDLIEMLRWLDWLGMFLRHRLLTNQDAIFDAIGWNVSEILNTAEPLIVGDRREEPYEYWWFGVEAVADSLREVREGIHEARISWWDSLPPWKAEQGAPECLVGLDETKMRERRLARSA